MKKLYDFLGIAIVFSIGVVCGRVNYVDPSTIQPVQDIIKMPNHIHFENTKFEKVYSNVDDDVAYYRYIGERDLIKKGDTVKLYNGDEYTVEAVDAIGFVINYYPSVGESGSAVLSLDGEQLGYISEALASGSCRCIWT